ncbi:hypothetical protein GUJ93_ZPchr0009g2121 [Zizania palustris]|uniref:Uncharacterized protein n=1 Tax=Zizania palustris TaxID=103762 RepID=A0A8J5R1A6_ZIZPA|nr:hypothetical protein GUJ93_ZPchr0009g2121 [Zizania palustris]
MPATQPCRHVPVRHPLCSAKLMLRIVISCSLLISTPSKSQNIFSRFHHLHSLIKMLSPMKTKAWSSCPSQGSES